MAEELFNLPNVILKSGGGFVYNSNVNVLGNLTVQNTLSASNLTVLGDYTIINTLTSNTDQMVINNDGTGPALIVRQTGAQPVAEFIDAESGSALFIADNGNVGIGTTIARSRLEVNGGILPSDCNLHDLGNSALRWRDLYISGGSIDIGGVRISTSNNDLLINDSISLLKGGLPVKRFMEQMPGGRNSFDCILFIDGDDNARAIGDDVDSRFGGTDIYAPAAILNLPNGEKASKIYGNVRNIYILSTTGNVYSTGRNAHNQCALPAPNTTANVIKPTLSAISNCVKVAHPTGHGGGATPYMESTMFLTSTGQVYSAGLNQVGQLGSGNTTTTANINPYLTLGPGNTFGNPATTVMDVLGTGSYNGTTTVLTFCALLSDGTVWCVGYGGDGQMGNGTTTATNTTWKQVQNAATSTALTNIVSIYGAGYHGGISLYALNSSGELFSWGYNTQGQLGLGNTTSPITRATRVTPFGSGVIVDVYPFNSAYGSVIVKMSNGDFYGCGYNGYGQLGTGDTTNKSTFTLITSLQGKNIEQIYYAGGDSTSHAIFAKELGTNRIYVTGRNNYAQNGLYDFTGVTSFTEVPFNITSPIVDIMPINTYGASAYTLILTADGNTYFAGRSLWGYAGGVRNIPIFCKNTYQLTGG